MCLSVRADDTEREFINAIDIADSEKSMYLFGGLSVEKISGGRSYQPASNVLDRVEQYLETHELKWSTSAEEEEEQARSASASGKHGITWIKADIFEDNVKADWAGSNGNIKMDVCDCGW